MNTLVVMHFRCVDAGSQVARPRAVAKGVDGFDDALVEVVDRLIPVDAEVEIIRVKPVVGKP